MKFNLSEITELIRHRRSILPEQFSARKVYREQVELILNNAIWAPTHGMTQPWRFKVFMEEGLERLAHFVPEHYRNTTLPGAFNQAKFDKMKQRFGAVSVVIAVCMERDRTGKIAEIEEIEAVACAVQNIYLTATAYGLGAFWSSPKLVYTKEMNDFLGLSDTDKCLGFVYLGYPSGDWPKSHRKPLEYVTEWIMKRT
jgi:nitroreductase